MSWRPRRLEGVDVTRLPLSPLDGFVLSRLDGVVEAGQLAGMTGLAGERVEEILSRLVRLGAVEGPPAASVAEGQEAPEDEATAEDAPPVAGDDGGVLRARFEQVLHSLPVDERAVRAPMADEPDLSAYCFDPSAQVVIALMHNPKFGLAHARLVARHHRDAHGLDALCNHPAFTADDVVRRELLKNPQLQAGVIRRLWMARRPLEQWKWASSREVTEQTRRTLREVLRQRFSTCTAEERVEVIIKTEGRSLAALAGLPVDGKTMAMLCARTYASAMLVQNIARWSSAPPPLIAHLLKQPLVVRTASLKNLLQAHPNAPRGG
jgi:hypothetical protein